ncbi:hypothetical protein, partial [Xanthomonas sacchari]|uniref:hypothetical protein n=1 Tax=Xanthomonas sacchari TaxID=56458 RepID=UPI001F282766
LSSKLPLRAAGSACGAKLPCPKVNRYIKPSTSLAPCYVFIINYFERIKITEDRCLEHPAPTIDRITSLAVPCLRSQSF